MFLIYMLVSFILLGVGTFAGAVSPLMAQIWVLTTLSVGSITYGLETPRKGK